MNTKVKFEDLGIIDYKEAWDYQTRLFDSIMNIKTGKSPQSTVHSPQTIKGNSEHETWNMKHETPNYLLFCEHPHVYTLGKSGSAENLLIDMLKLKNINATYYKINRGGDITYHGPGQIVGYPIIDMENFSLGVKDYINKLEEAIIITLAEYGITAGRLDGATGVWLGTNNNNDSPLERGQRGVFSTNSELRTNNSRKICAIGVRTSRYITMHGFAFNVNTDLTYFNHINPCGFTDKSVTSMKQELGKKQDFDRVKLKLKANIAKVFGMELI